MSNPAINILIDIIIANERLIIEDNLGEAIHIHYGNIRLSVSISKFEEIEKTISESAEMILDEVGLDFFSIDPTAFLWGWTDFIMGITKTEIKTIKLGDLLSTRTYGAVFGLGGIQIPASVSQSRIVKALNGDYKELEQYTQINYKQIDNIRRLNLIRQSIIDNGYPYKKQYIIVDQNYRIHDGDHRAGCLFKMYGGNYKIPVIVFNMGKEERNLSSAEIRRIVKSRKKDYNKKIVECLKSKIKEKWKINNKKEKYKKEKYKKEKNILPLWEEFEQYLNREQVQYFIIEGILIEPKYREEIDRKVVVHPNSFSKVLTYLDHISIRIEKLNKEKIETIYSLERPRFFCFGNMKIALCDKLYCKSFYWNVLLPLDNDIQELLWNTRKKIEADYICFIVNWIMGQWIIEKNGMEYEYLDENINLLEKKEVFNCLKKEFFNFTEKLIEMLKNRKYESILGEYIKFREY